jgi:hypothetical protein
MTQVLVNARRTQPLHETLRDRIQSGMAATVINQALNGVDVPRKQLDTAIFVVGKFLPSYAAVAMAVHEDRPESIHDLNSMLLSNGINVLPDMQAIDSVENSDSAQEESERGAPPDAEA